MPVIIETAIVYRGAGRRYFTKGGALRSFAKAAIKRRCDCERDDPATGYPGNTCKYHQEWSGQSELIKRFCRLYKHAIQKTGDES